MKKDDRILEMVAKSICAFLNSDGGCLFIGIKDNGTIKGLDSDYDLANGKDPKDYFRLAYDQMFKDFIGFSFKNKVSEDFYKILGKEIFVVTVFPSQRRPVFLKTKNTKKFFIRAEASTQQITDIEEIINYWIERSERLK